MPIYEYHCEHCGANFDKLIRSFSAPAEVECPHCQSTDCRKSISLFAAVPTGGRSSAGASCAPAGGG
ncbi:MAG: zinc ribbon domain-containing protein [Chloroflexi bacterium]|nr:zinc ribbon domain-containing protein [Chloroflexota bacterium]